MIELLKHSTLGMYAVAFTGYWSHEQHDKAGIIRLYVHLITHKMKQITRSPRKTNREEKQRDIENIKN